MKGLGLLAAVFVVLLQMPGAVRAEEGCNRPLGGPCISDLRKPKHNNVCHTRKGSCPTALAKGKRCKCDGARGRVR